MIWSRKQGFGKWKTTSLYWIGPKGPVEVLYKVFFRMMPGRRHSSANLPTSMYGVCSSAKSVSPNMPRNTRRKSIQVPLSLLKFDSTFSLCNCIIYQISFLWPIILIMIYFDQNIHLKQNILYALSVKYVISQVMENRLLRQLYY